MPGIPIPATDTNYLCVNHEAPVTQKHHIVAYKEVLNNSVSSKLIHHMILYGCRDAPIATNSIFECSSMPKNCDYIALVWAVGAGLTQYPDEAGFPMGIARGAYKYFSLQVHYNNPTKISNAIDSSGLRIYYTPKLRKYDVGTLTLGEYDLFIPGNSSSFTSTKQNICPSACTRMFPWDLHVIGNHLHMHTLGYNMSTRVIRDGHEIEPLGIRRFYNFGFQGMSPTLEKGAVIKPGDTLISRCTFIPTDKLHANRMSHTHFGITTSDEMCFNFVVYYPAMEQDWQQGCVSEDGAVRCGDKWVDSKFPVFESKSAETCPNAFTVEFGSTALPYTKFELEELRR